MNSYGSVNTAITCCSTSISTQGSWLLLNNNLLESIKSPYGKTFKFKGMTDGGCCTSAQNNYLIMVILTVYFKGPASILQNILLHVCQPETSPLIQSRFDTSRFPDELKQ